MASYDNNLALLERGDAHPEQVENAIRELVGERPQLELHLTERGRVPTARIGSLEVVGDDLDNALQMLGIAVARKVREVEIEARAAKAKGRQ